MQQTEKVIIKKIKDGEEFQIQDIVIVEQAFTLFVNGKKAANLVCSPSHIRELAYGFLCTEGFISSGHDVLDLAINPGGGLIRAETSAARPGGLLQHTITSCRGRGGASFCSDDAVRGIIPVKGDIKIPAGQLSRLGREMEDHGRLFRATGGTHGAALCGSEKMLCFFEDVGRHNAVDKVFGHCMLNHIPRHDKLLLLTGRVSAEILLKAARMGIPLLASRSAPTGLALELARQLNITVVGFLRENRMNIYTRPERVIE